jgi:hypothetical protein
MKTGMVFLLAVVAFDMSRTLLPQSVRLREAGLENRGSTRCRRLSGQAGLCTRHEF